MKPCPICDTRGPWPTSKARAEHIRSHHEADCPECGKSVNKASMKSHRRILHGVPVTAELNTPTAPPAAPEPAPEPAPAAAEELRCAECGKGPFETLKGFRGHQRSHTEIECPDCGKRIKAIGLGPHRRACTARATSSSTPPPARPATPKPSTTAATAGRYVRCSDCGHSFHEANLAAHRKRMHRTPTSPAPRATAGLVERARPADHRPLAESLAELIPGAAPELLDRLARFAARYDLEDAGGRLLVATATAGPWLVPPPGAGMVIAREHTAAVVVAVEDLVTHAAKAAAS